MFTSDHPSVTRIVTSGLSLEDAQEEVGIWMLTGPINFRIRVAASPKFEGRYDVVHTTL